MSSTEQRTAANRANALKSTGPTTKDGKNTVSRNATRHGLFSNRLFLDDEDPADFDQLQLELHASLNPVGAVELAFVERIAINMWRQRRLVTAETAAIRLAREPNEIADTVNRQLRLGYDSELKEQDLQPFDEEQARWCNSVVDEIDGLEQIDLAVLERNAPLAYRQLTSDAESDHEDLATHVEQYDGGLTGFVSGLYDYCREQLRVAERRPHILAIAEEVRCKRLVLPRETLELFTRYQTSLDNQLYKALKALREAQEWRLKTIDAAADGKFVDALAA